MGGVGAEDIAQLIETYTQQRWKTRGYGSWAAYIAARYGERTTKMPVAERKAAVRAMHAADMSFKAIGIALGVGHQTAYRDIYGRLERDHLGPVCVYMIGSPSFRPVKIGKGYPQERLEAFQTASPFELEVMWARPGGLELEQSLHMCFEPYRVRGEWFEFPAGMDPVRAVSAAADGIRHGFTPA